MAPEQSSLASWPARLAGARVVVLGDLVLDTFVFGLSERISREAPVVIVQEARREHLPGGAANVLANLAALGAQTTAVGVTGADQDAARLTARLGELGSDLQHVLKVPGRVTDTKTRILAGGRSTTPQQVLRLDRGNDAPLDEAAEGALIQALSAACADADALIVSDYGLGAVPRAVAAAACALSAQLPVLVDSRFGLRGFRGATWVKPNLPELEAAVGHGLPDLVALEAAVAGLCRELGFEGVLATRGHEGMSLLSAAAAPEHLAPHGPPEAVDVTGAGDTVISVFAAALAAGAEAGLAARLANIAGGLVVQKPGTATVSAAELEAAARGVVA